MCCSLYNKPALSPYAPVLSEAVQGLCANPKWAKPWPAEMAFADREAQRMNAWGNEDWSYSELCWWPRWRIHKHQSQEQGKEAKRKWGVVSWCAKVIELCIFCTVYGVLVQRHSQACGDSASVLSKLITVFLCKSPDYPALIFPYW